MKDYWLQVDTWFLVIYFLLFLLLEISPLVHPAMADMSMGHYRSFHSFQYTFKNENHLRYYGIPHCLSTSEFWNVLQCS